MRMSYKKSTYGPKKGPCFIPGCKSSSEMGKVMVFVPNALHRRKMWFAAAKIPLVKTVLHCCEDHFNLEQDAENWTFFKMMGTKLRLKPHAVPHLNLDSPKNSSEISQFDESYREMKQILLEKIKKELYSREEDECSTRKRPLENWPRKMRPTIKCATTKRTTVDRSTSPMCPASEVTFLPDSHTCENEVTIWMEEAATSDDVASTCEEFKTHKLKVKRLKRTAVPTLQLPVKDEPIPISDDEECEIAISEVSPTNNRNQEQQQSEADKYSIGSYVCTSCGHLASSETLFFEHLNSHVKLESHNRGDGVDVDPLGQVKVEPDESHFLPEDDEGDPFGDDNDSADDVDPFDQVTHPDDADGGTIKDGDAGEPESDSSLEDEYDEDDPGQPTEKPMNYMLEERLAGGSDDTRVVNGPTITRAFRRNSSSAKLKYITNGVLNKRYWRRRERYTRFPPFSKQKLEHGDPVYWAGDRPRFTCVQCQFVAQTPRLFKVHFQRHAEGKRFGCVTCQNFFDTEEALIAKHTSGSSCGHIRVVDFQLRCDECWEFFKTQQELVHHLLYDYCPRKIKVPCAVCNKEVIKCNMESHLKKHKSKVTEKSVGD